MKTITTKSKSSYHLLMLAFSFLIAFILHLLLFATAPMVTVIIDEMYLSYADFGFIFSSAMISLIILRIPWGILADKIGYLNAFRIALPLSVASAAVRAFAPGYSTLLICQFFLGSGLACILPCLPLLVKEWAPQRIGLFTGIYISGFAAGSATALGLTPNLLLIMEWRHILLACSGLAAIVCILWWTLARSSMKSSSGMQFRQFILILKDRYVWILLVLMIVAMGSYDTLATWMPKVLEFKRLDKVLASLLPLGFFLSGPVVGLVMDRFHYWRIIIMICGAIDVAAIIGINYAPYPLLLLCIFVAGFTTIGLLTISLAVPAQHERLSMAAASIVGMTSALGNIGPLVMPVLFGFLIDITGSYYASIFAVAALASVALFISPMVREHDKKIYYPP